MLAIHIFIDNVFGKWKCLDKTTVGDLIDQLKQAIWHLFCCDKKGIPQAFQMCIKRKNSCCFFIVKRYLVCTFVSCPNWHFSTWVKPYIPLGQIQRRTWDFCTTFGRTIVCLENSCLVQYTYIVLLYNGLGSIIRSPFTQLEQALYPKF